MPRPTLSLCLPLALLACSSPSLSPTGTTSSGTTTTWVPPTTSSSSSSSTDSSSSSSTSMTTTGTGGSPACTIPIPGPPASSSYQFTLGAQTAWSHDDGFPAGWFHTYDALQVAGPSDMPRQVHVFLPRAYTACSAGYPVVYMNDGNTTFWPGGLANKTWDVATALGALHDQQAIPDVIVVAIVPLDREAEYTHADWEPGHHCCGVEQYTGYVADHVKAFIDANYRTLGGPESTAIIGSSHGGLAAFYMANRRPEVFGKAGCLSSSFWAGLDPVQGGSYSGGPLSASLLIADVKTTLADASKRPRMWIDWGLVRSGGFQNSDIEAAATTRGKEMVSLLETSYGYAAGSAVFSYEDPLGEHDEVSWGRRFPMVMKALFGAP